MLDISKSFLHQIMYICMGANRNVLGNLPHLETWYRYRAMTLYVRLDLQPLPSLQLGRGFCCG